MSAYPVWLQLIYLGLLIVGAVSCWAFVALYTYLYRWWTSGMGSHLVAMSTVVGLFYTYLIVVSAWPDIPGRAWIRFSLFCALTAILVWRLLVFLQFRRHELVRETTEE